MHEELRAHVAAQQAQQAQHGRGVSMSVGEGRHAAWVRGTGSVRGRADAAFATCCLRGSAALLCTADVLLMYC